MNIPIEILCVEIYSHLRDPTEIAKLSLLSTATHNYAQDTMLTLKLRYYHSEAMKQLRDVTFIWRDHLNGASLDNEKLFCPKIYHANIWMTAQSVLLGPLGLQDATWFSLDGVNDKRKNSYCHILNSLIPPHIRKGDRVWA
jgi:hypothetical protein